MFNLFLTYQNDIFTLINFSGFSSKNKIQSTKAKSFYFTLE